MLCTADLELIICLQILFAAGTLLGCTSAATKCRDVQRYITRMVALPLRFIAKLVALPLSVRHNTTQEWLWCETWCGNATLGTAKTIDLCNNPLTKEPKLAGARRIVAEWPALDAEVIAFTAQVPACAFAALADQFRDPQSRNVVSMRQQ